MPKFTVPITRDCTETTMVDVIAENATGARDLALVEAVRTPEAFEWVADECSGNQAEPYFAGGDDLEAIVCGQCEGTGTTDAMDYSEQCPVCDGSGQIKGEDV